LQKKNFMQTALFLIPVTLGETEHRRVLPAYNREVILRIRHFVVEDVRTARRFLKKVDPSIQIDELTFYELNKHSSPQQVSDYLDPLAKGEPVGILSEAGCPAVADPGAEVVAMAQERNYPVIPLVGPSAILMALMASGFNGQNFAFHGYLPIDSAARAMQIKALEARMYAENQTQLFMETPYRNNHLLDDLVRLCKPATKLCVAANITCNDEYIRTRRVLEWGKGKPDLHRKPALFLLYK
jgi:16S rRNA (cytidine1402-2'-O)-methyltransferase